MSLYPPFLLPLKAFTIHAQVTQATDEPHSGQRQDRTQYELPSATRKSFKVTSLIEPSQEDKQVFTYTYIEVTLETTNALPSALHLEAHKSNILTSESTSQFFPKQECHARIYSNEI
jgi:hypothetical protein